MKGAFIRPLRLIRRLAVVTALAAALAVCGAFDGLRANAPAVFGAARELCESAGNALGDAIPVVKEALNERVVPALAEAVDNARDNLAASEKADGAGDAVETNDTDGEKQDASENADGAEQDANEVPILRRNADAPRLLALTFDDGPHQTRTAPILDLLAKYGVKATFFVIGENAAAHPELIAREIAEGHEVANHTMTHAALSRLSYGDALREVLDAEQAIFPDGAGRSTLLRPPCGAVGQSAMRVAGRLDMSLVLWSVDTRDWEHKSAETIVKTVREGVRGGDVILFHDFISGEAHTLEALETLIPALAAEGYEFVTVSELFGNEGEEMPDA